MFPGNPNPFLQATPGKVVLDIQRKRMPSGQIVEARKTEVTILENGRWHKETVWEIDPGMADGTSPELRDVRECHLCISLFHKDNVRQCVACGRDYCGRPECRGEVRMSEDEIIILCAPCARANNTGLLSRLSRKFWRLGK
jgi:hypothetical protein